MSFNTTLHLPLRPSRLQQLWLLALHGLAVLCLPWLEPALTVAAGVLWAASAGWCWYRFHHQPAHQLQCQPGGLLQLDGEPIQLLPQPFVSIWLISLRYRSQDGRKATLLIWPDSCDAVARRRLRVWLRWCWART
ncbi:protein YgfX [Parachitinimonas caeni]|uniref:Toxin CptA n=1 Tax=Parachitinimonas caeni TaxID=3031301 RepID=A0ABT7DTE0_9NEIS|nr:protein YgfX [Parachitinimonas caeni]MDK2123330.1 hypothetical protein [Parachitinimonas caeni]